jgi:hypothetical protein
MKEAGQGKQGFVVEDRSHDQNPTCRIAQVEKGVKVELHKRQQKIMSKDLQRSM